MPNDTHDQNTTDRNAGFETQRTQCETQGTQPKHGFPTAEHSQHAVPTRCSKAQHIRPRCRNQEPQTPRHKREQLKRKRGNAETHVPVPLRSRQHSHELNNDRSTASCSARGVLASANATRGNGHVEKGMTSCQYSCPSMFTLCRKHNAWVTRKTRQ